MRRNYEIALSVNRSEQVGLIQWQKVLSRSRLLRSSSLRCLLLRSSIAATFLVIGASHIYAQTKTFSNTSGTWTNAGNWSPSGVPTAANDVLISGGTNNMTLTAANMSIQYITFTNTSSRILENATGGTTASNLTLGGTDSNGNLINLNNASATPTFTIRNGTTASLNLVLASSGNFNVNTGGNLSISSSISESDGSRMITKTGAGALSLLGANSHSGGLTLNAGTLRVGVGNVGTLGNITSSAIGTGGLTLNGGTFSSDSNTARTILNAVIVGGNVTLGNATNSGALTFSATTDLGGATRQITTASAVNLNGVVSNGGLTKLGSGTLTLGAANTYSGETIVSAGTLALGNVNALQNTTLNTGASGTQQVTFIVAGSNTYNIGGLSGADALAIGGNTISVGSNNANTSFTGVISGSGGGVAKVGTGTLTLTNANTYTGGTTVSNGTLIVNNTTGSGTGTGAVTVEAGGTLAGTGIIAGEVTVNGTLNPGNSPGTLTFLDDLILAGVLNMEITGVNPGDYDVLLAGNLGRTITFGGTLALDNTGYTANLGDTITLFQSWATYSGAFANITGTDLGGGLFWDTSSLGTNGTITVSAVPEPTSIIFGSIAVAAGGFGAWKRRRRSLKVEVGSVKEESLSA